MTPAKLFLFLIEERANMTDELNFKVKKVILCILILIEQPKEACR